MKKLIVTLILTAGVYSYSHAQGSVDVYNIGGANGNYTNGALSSYSGGTSSGGVSALTGTAANGYIYELLFATFGGPVPSANPLAAVWSGVMGATNYLVAGGIRGTGALGGAATTWPGGAQTYFELVGWSSNLGLTWGSLSNQVATGTWSANGFFGVSPVSIITPSVSPAPAQGIFGGTGLASGITLYAVLVPEPTTMALVGLGGLSLLLFRRRK